jgi:hypothetical protein
VLRARHLTAIALVALTAACGSSTPEPQPVDTSANEPKRVHHDNVAVNAEIGALDEGATKKVFMSAKSKMDECWRGATSRLPYLAGSVSFRVRVDHQGHPKEVHLKESTLGDFDMEKCLVDAVKAMDFPTPQGGQDGIANFDGVEFPANDEVRAPVEWSETDMGKSAKDARQALAACKAQGGGGSLQATLYVGVDGKVKSAGVSGEASPTAGDCAVEKLKKLKFNSPGSYAAKISLASD